MPFTNRTDKHGTARVALRQLHADGTTAWEAVSRRDLSTFTADSEHGAALPAPLTETPTSQHYAEVS